MGNPASVSNSAARIMVKGTFSEGFNTMVFPQAKAMGNVQWGT
jgi:hypothetical protein